MCTSTRILPLLCGLSVLLLFTFAVAWHLIVQPGAFPAWWVVAMGGTGLMGLFLVAIGIVRLFRKRGD